MQEIISRKSSELGFNWLRDKLLYQRTCRQCDGKSWVAHKKDLQRVCLDCHKQNSRDIRKSLTGSKHPRWNSGRMLSKSGYYLVHADKDDPYYSMCNRHHHIWEHRLIMAKSLGRCLEPWETVHHRNGIKTDNRIENLELLPQSRHNTLAHAHFRKLEKRVKDLENTVSLLLWHIKELGHGNTELNSSTPTLDKCVEDIDSAPQEGEDMFRSYVKT